MESKLKCKICGSKNSAKWTTARDVEYFTTENEYDYFECLDCKTLNISPIPINEISKIYPSNYYAYSSSYHKNLIVKIKESLDKKFFKNISNMLIGESFSVLDIGGGEGAILDIARKADQKFKQFTIVDLDENARTKAILKGYNFHKTRIEDIQIFEKFDLILMFNLIEHIEDPVATLVKLKSLLKPGGLIVIKTPNYLSVDATLFKGNSWTGLHCPRHWTIFSQESIELAVKKSKLKINILSFTQGAPFWAASIVSLLGQKGLLNLNKSKPAPFHALMMPLAGLFALFDFLRIFLGFKTSQMWCILENDA